MLSGRVGCFDEVDLRVEFQVVERTVQVVHLMPDFLFGQVGRFEFTAA